MSEETPLVRQWLLLRGLCAKRQGMSVREMADEMGVVQKTIRRDLETFQLVGFKLREEVGPRGKKLWRMDHEKGQPEISFTADEAISLYLGRHLLEPLAGTLFWDGAQRAFRKIRASLGNGSTEILKRFSTLFHHTARGASDYSQKAELIDRLMLAIEDRRAVSIAYHSLRSTEPVTYDIHPFGMIYHSHSLYLIGHSPSHDEIRHWKVDRVESAELTNDHFLLPDNFNLKSHLSESFGIFSGHGNIHIKIHFAAAVARYVEEQRWHQSQTLTPQPDGSFLAEFDLNATEEIKSWILSFGRHAVVLEPKELREEIMDEAESLIARCTKADQTLHSQPSEDRNHAQ